MPRAQESLTDSLLCDPCGNVETCENRNVLDAKVELEKAVRRVRAMIAEGGLVDQDTMEAQVDILAAVFWGVVGEGMTGPAVVLGESISTLRGNIKASGLEIRDTERDVLDKMDDWLARHRAAPRFWSATGSSAVVGSARLPRTTGTADRIPGSDKPRP